MHGKLRAMVSWVSSFYAVACAPLCSCVCVYIRGGEQYLKGQTFYFSRSQKSQAGAGSVTFSLWWGRNITVEGNVEKCRGEERMESGGKEKREGRREDVDTEREVNEKVYSWKASGPPATHFFQRCPTF